MSNVAEKYFVVKDLRNIGNRYSPADKNPVAKEETQLT